MYLQNVESMYDLVWTRNDVGLVTYGDVFLQNEQEMSAYNFEHANTEWLFKAFDEAEISCQKLLEAELSLPAYEQVLRASHTFNLLDARHAISVTERQRFILKVRNLARRVADSYFSSRKRAGFPLADDVLRAHYLEGLPDDHVVLRFLSLDVKSYLRQHFPRSTVSYKASSKRN